MSEPRPEMMPGDKFPDAPSVPGDVKPPVSKDVKTEGDGSEPEKTQPQEPDKKPVVGQDPPDGLPATPATVPYQAMKEERTKRKEAEGREGVLKEQLEEAKEELTKLKEDPGPSTDPFEGDPEEGSDPTLPGRVKDLEEETALNKITQKYPVIAEREEDFREFREDYPSYKLEDVAELFLTKRGLRQEDEPPARTGLETPTAGDRTPPESGYTQEEIKDLRENHPRRYNQLIGQGIINSEDIK